MTEGGGGREGEGVTEGGRGREGGREEERRKRQRDKRTSKREGGTGGGGRKREGEVRSRRGREVNETGMKGSAPESEYDNDLVIVPICHGCDYHISTAPLFP